MKTLQLKQQADNKTNCCSFKNAKTIKKNLSAGNAYIWLQPIM